MGTTNGFGSSRLSIAAAWLGLGLAGPVAGQVTTRVSVDSGEGQADKDCIQPVISADGRYVAFTAYTDLTGGGPIAVLGQPSHIYLRDRQNGTTERVNLNSSGQPGNDYSYNPSLSSDVRYVAFSSFSTNLVPGDTNGPYPIGHDIFVRDRQSGTTERVSVDSSGGQANDECYGPSMSADGRYVVFFGPASNLVAGDTNGVWDVFVRDRQSGTTERISVSSGGAEGNGDSAYGGWALISADGRYVAFYSSASNLVVGDTNGVRDVFVHDRQSGTTERVSLSSGGTEGNDDSYSAAISPDGRYVAFDSFARNLVAGDSNGVRDVFVHDRQSGTTERVSVASSGAQGNGESRHATISPDGRYVVFGALASNLVEGDTNAQSDVFLRDRLSGTTERVSVDSSGAEGDNNSGPGPITPDGRYVVFSSQAKLVVEDTNGSVSDIFVRDRAATGFTSFCDPGQDGVIACPCSNPPAGAGRGCDNFGAGPADSGTLTATGVAYLDSDSVVLHATGENDDSLTVFWTGTQASSSGVSHGAGVRCVSGFKRLYTGVASGGEISQPSVGDPSVSARSAAVGQPISAGETRHYFTIYRDANAAGPCGDTASTVNLTNAGSISWNL